MRPGRLTGLGDRRLVDEPIADEFAGAPRLSPGPSHPAAMGELRNHSYPNQLADFAAWQKRFIPELFELLTPCDMPLKNRAHSDRTHRAS